jgi:hypothetical protein
MAEFSHSCDTSTPATPEMPFDQKAWDAEYAVLLAEYNRVKALSNNDPEKKVLLGSVLAKMYDYNSRAQKAQRDASQETAGITSTYMH